MITTKEGRERGQFIQFPALDHELGNDRDHTDFVHLVHDTNSVNTVK